jgi:hypothetical protein
MRSAAASRINRKPREQGSVLPPVRLHDRNPSLLICARAKTRDEPTACDFPTLVLLLQARNTATFDVRLPHARVFDAPPISPLRFDWAAR